MSGAWHSIVGKEPGHDRKHAGRGEYGRPLLGAGVNILGRGGGGHGGGGHGHGGHGHGHRGHSGRRFFGGGGWGGYGPWGWGGPWSYGGYGGYWPYDLPYDFGGNYLATVPLATYPDYHVSVRRVHHLMGAEARSRARPPTAHQRHHDYVFVEGHGWRPQWYPYWDPAWHQYWASLYDYYGGDSNPEYAELARDEALRVIARQRGWL